MAHINGNGKTESKKDKGTTYNGEIGREALQQITISEDLEKKFNFFINEETGDLCVEEKEENKEKASVKGD